MTHGISPYVVPGIFILVLLVASTGRPKRRRRGRRSQGYHQHTRKYDRYMKSRRWRARRAFWFYTSNKRCEVCGCRLALHHHGMRYQLGAKVATFHHKTYDRLGHERRSDVVMCDWGCHQRFDGWRFR